MGRPLAIALLTLALAAGLPAAVTVAEPTPNPYFDIGADPGSGVGKRIGYISLNESEPFVRLVTEGILEQAAVAGVELVMCDARLDQSEALDCARQLAETGVEGVINFQAWEDGAPDVCAAYGGLPTIAIDIRQPPCEVAFAGVDNRQAGLIVGRAMGSHLREASDCAYDSVLTLDAEGAGSTVLDRMAATLDGFAEVCGPIPADRLEREGVYGLTMGDEVITSWLRSTEPGGTHVVFSASDNTAMGALRGARAIGRGGELLSGSHGADPSSFLVIACDPQWIADVAYFPERYGRTVIPAMIDLLDGKEIPADLYTTHQAVDATNIRDLYPETPPCP
jgi:ribose transport system substrate-binding protein